ncbi:MAG: hypothetical protein JWQ45_2670 [Blastococcus sp.]|nr:hypothetical protein [Blastococcus sp.]
MAALALAPILALLVAVAVGLDLVGRWLSGGTVARQRQRQRGHSPRAALPEPARRPLQVVAADVRRLARQLALVPAGAPLVRWQALWTAYDAVLMEAAEQLEVAHELTATCVGMPRDIERLRVLAALESAGLVVRA